MKSEMSKRFQEFFQRIEMETDKRIEFEVPYLDLAFEGKLERLCSVRGSH